MGKIGLAVGLAEKTAKFVKACGKQSIVQTKAQKLKNIYRLKYNKLNTDTLQLTSYSIWAGNPEKFIPKAFEGSAISLHHQMHSFNSSSSVRDVLTNIKQGIFREKDVPLLRKIVKTDKEFTALPALEKDCLVYRGRMEHPIISEWNKDFDIIDKAKIGDTFIPDTAYSYAATKSEIAKLWAKPSKEYKTMLYEIRLPKGAKVSRNLEHEGEIIMPRGAEYKFISKNVDSSGRRYVVLEYILPDKEKFDEIKKIEKFLEQFPTVPEPVVQVKEKNASKPFFKFFLNLFNK